MRIRRNLHHKIKILNKFLNLLRPVRRSQRAKKSAISDYYETYLSEDVYDIGNVSDPATFRQAVLSENSTKWIEAMEDDLRSMSTNKV